MVVEKAVIVEDVLKEEEESMKFNFKRSMAIMLATIMFLGTSASASGMTLFYANKGRSGAYVFVEAAFTPKAKTTNTKYGLKKNKYVKKVTIRLQEGKGYDKSKFTTTGKHIKLSKLNNPLIKSSGSWKWEYK